ncbi:MAG TPA: hypothetical protein VGF40_18150 [Thermoanaerobaculia bacterium]
MKKLLLTMAVVALLVPALASAQTTRLSPQMQRVMDDITRLQAILTDASANVDFSDATWRTVANEANALANRIVGRTSSWRSESRDAAKNLRMHVREMRAAALKGDEAGAKKHAAEALPFATTLAARIRGTT